MKERPYKTLYLEALRKSCRHEMTDPDLNCELPHTHRYALLVWAERSGGFPIPEQQPRQL
jgi:hypothetical protein